MLKATVMGARLVVRSLWSDAEPTFEYAFDQERIVIGRRKGADILIPHAAVSLHHVTIATDGSQYVATDQGSTNGTYVNGERLPPGRAKALVRGDYLDCGGFRVEFVGPVPVVSTTSETRTASLARRIVRAALEADPLEPAHLVVVSEAGDHSFRLPEPPARLTVGTESEADFPIPNVSPPWLFEIEADVDGYIMRATEEANFCVGSTIMRERRLRHGDELVVNDAAIRFFDPAETQVQELAKAGEQRLEAPVSPAPEPPPPEDDGASKGSATGQEERTPSKRVSRPKMPGTDLVIYALAGAVLVLSIAALMVLLQS